MKQYNFDSFIVKDASWFDVFKWLVTRGKKGKLYIVIKNPPPKHFNCRCSVVDEVV